MRTCTTSCKFRAVADLLVPGMILAAASSVMQCCCAGPTIRTIRAIHVLRRPRLRLLLLLLLPVWLLAGCQTGGLYDGLPKKLVQLHSVSEDIVRWRDLRKLYLFTKPGSDWPVQPGLENVRVNGYEAARLQEIEPWRWGQSVVISYVLIDRQVVKNLLDQQIWVSEEEGKNWYRESPPPVF